MHAGLTAEVLQGLRTVRRLTDPGRRGSVPILRRGGAPHRFAPNQKRSASAETADARPRRAPRALFPVITGQTGLDPIFQGAADFDLELVENRTLDGHIQELIYRPTLH
jgi:hypothetical protein